MAALTSSHGVTASGLPRPRTVAKLFALCFGHRHRARFGRDTIPNLFNEREPVVNAKPIDAQRFDCRDHNSKLTESSRNVKKLPGSHYFVVAAGRKFSSAQLRMWSFRSGTRCSVHPEPGCSSDRCWLQPL